MKNSSQYRSWIERAIRICDQVLTKAAVANPTNLLLRDMTSQSQLVIRRDPEPETQGISQQLAS